MILYLYMESLFFILILNRIGGVMVSVLASSAIASSAIDHGFKPRLGQTKDYEIDICC
jgi:hypothetical protein